MKGGAHERPRGTSRANAVLTRGSGLKPRRSECAVRGKVSRRSLEGWVAKLAEGDDRQASAEALRRRLVEKANEVELVGRREAA